MIRKINEFKDESLSDSKIIQDKLEDANNSLKKINFFKKMKKDEYGNLVLTDEEIIKYKREEENSQL